MVDPRTVGSLARDTLRRHLAERRLQLDADEEFRKCKERFAYFLFGHCRTQDEHDLSQFAKPFPRKEYLLRLADTLQSHRRIAIEKSRQLMASWICCAFVLWVAMFHPNILFFVQSKKEEDAADRLDRIYKLYFRLPQFFRDRFPINGASGRPGNPLYTELHFTWQPEDIDLFEMEGDNFEYLLKTPNVRSKIQAIPQGADVVRQFSVSGIFSDEDAFQVLAGEAYSAIMPTLGPDNWYIKVSTANPGHFESVAKDREIR